MLNSAFVGQWYVTAAGKMAKIVEIAHHRHAPTNYRLAHADGAYEFWHDVAGRVEYIVGLADYDIVGQS